MLKYLTENTSRVLQEPPTYVNVVASFSLSFSVPVAEHRTFSNSVHPGSSCYEFGWI